jgi:hypothetical protein
MKYHFNNFDLTLREHDGEEVEYIGRYPSKFAVPGISNEDQLHKIRFQDGREAIVFADELINPVAA